MPDRVFVVAIDGPSAAGKSTVGAIAAERLQAALLDTGVLYRALTLSALEGGVSVDDAAALAALASKLDVDIRAAKRLDDPIVLMDGRDISREIRTPSVDGSVSRVSSFAAVRDALLPAQRRAARPPSTVVIGRDIGTIVFPDAELKIYLDASSIERARRRMSQSPNGRTFEQVRAAIEERDTLDMSRAVAPLLPAADAATIDTNGLSIEQVVTRIVEMAQARRAARE